MERGTEPQLHLFSSAARHTPALDWRILQLVCRKAKVGAGNTLFQDLPHTLRSAACAFCGSLARQSTFDIIGPSR